MAERLIVVTGKGGVGKSTVAAALALAHAEHGLAVLGIDLDAPGGAGRALGVQLSQPGVIVAAGGSLCWTYVDGVAALGEYLRRKAHLGKIANAVLGHPAFDAFVHAAPGAKELMAIGKVRDELLLQHRWDAVVVDAGSSGHALGYLRMPLAAARSFRRGLVHREAMRVHDLLANSAHTEVRVVTTAEEMPVREAVDTVRCLRDELGLPLAPLVVNRCISPPPGDLDAALALLSDLRMTGGNAVASAARRARGWARIQERSIARLERGTRLPLQRLPRLCCDAIGRAELRALGARLLEAP
ncbi:MAG: ArsA-related P-loop ATPase [Polyangiaceae bacterium]